MKRFFALVLTALMLVCFAACGDGAKKFNVRFHIDGEIVSEKQIEEGMDASYTPEARDGYTFDGWYTDEQMEGEKVSSYRPSGDADLYGRWMKNNSDDETTFTVTFIVDGTVTKVTVKKGEKATMETPKKANFIFVGWFETENGTGEAFDLNTPIERDMTLYAKWDAVHAPQTYTVTFELAGGEATPAIPAQSIREGEKVTEPTSELSRDGFVFRGWYRDGEPYDFDRPVTDSFTLTAYWEEVLSVTDGKYSANSASAGHDASLAGDGSRETYWQAAEVGEQELTVDLGGMQEVRRVTQVFAQSGEWSFEVEGSADGEHWATLGAPVSTNEADTYRVTAGGYFRYIRLCVAANSLPASSREFSIETTDPAKGTNIALGMKGSSGDWAPGSETEKAFNGNYDDYFCANNGDMGKYLAVEWTSTCWVEYVDFYMSDSGVYNFEVEVRHSDGTTWEKVETASDHDGQMFHIDVKREVNAVLIRVFGTPEGNSKWVAVREMNVYGFKDAASYVVPETESDKDVYDLGESYISRISADGTIEISSDNSEWTTVTSEEAIEKHARYVRVDHETPIEIFATRFENDLARYIVPTASDSSNEDRCKPPVCTMNPENVWEKDNRFWCAATQGGEHTLTLDLGNLCVVDRLVYTFQDNITEAKYKLKVEFSADGQSYKQMYDTFGEPEAGQTFTVEGNNEVVRYIKITVEYVDGWANCKLLQVFGVGAPVRPIEIR